MPVGQVSSSSSPISTKSVSPAEATRPCCCPANYTTDGSEAGHTLLLNCLFVHLCEHLAFFCCTLLLGLLVTSQLFASCY